MAANKKTGKPGTFRKPGTFLFFRSQSKSENRNVPYFLGGNMHYGARKFLFFLAFILISIFLAVNSVEAGSIVLKIIAANPSKQDVQKIPIKAYLPKEAKPEDIMDKGDLEIAYDTQQGSYYVYGEYELKPGEVLEKNIEMRDIWNIPNTELESLRAESSKIATMLKGTEFSDRISFLHNSIESKLNQIMESQKAVPTNPAQRISDYRENLKLFEGVKADLVLARSLLSQAKALPTAAIWKIILAIIIFLGLLGASFYFLWQKQLKTIAKDDTFFVPKEEQEPERHTAEPKKET
jgi:hypothetical protein